MKSKFLPTVLIAFVVVAIALSLGFGLSRGPSNSETGSSYSPGLPARSETVPLADVGRRLSDDQELVVTILGDNTGKSIGGWVYLFSQWIGKTFDRSVFLYTWNIEELTFSAPEQVWVGNGPRVEIWNGSASARTADYTHEHLGALMGSGSRLSDLILYSHGHNHGVRTLAVESTSILKELKSAFPDAAIGVVLQNPQRRTQDSSVVHDQNVMDLQFSAAINGFETLDVYGAFGGRDLSSLLDRGGIFPSAEGYILWSKVIQDAIASS